MRRGGGIYNLWLEGTVRQCSVFLPYYKYIKVWPCRLSLHFLSSIDLCCLACDSRPIECVEGEGWYSVMLHIYVHVYTYIVYIDTPLYSVYVYRCPCCVHMTWLAYIPRISQCSVTKHWHLVPDCMTVLLVVCYLLIAENNLILL